MNAVAADAPDSPRYRWLGWAVLVFAVQIGLIFWLSDRHPPQSRPTVAGPALTLAPAGNEEILALYDPTLFALPHRRGFSGEAWLRRTNPPAPSFEWREEPRYLPIPVESLGASFQQFMQTNVFATAQGLVPPEPELNVPAPVRFQILPERSTLRIEGQLQNRKLLTPIDLPSQPAAELLSPTVVQVVVDQEGRLVSTALLSASGSPQADKYALDQLRRARFERAKTGNQPASPHEELAWGRVVFEWLTVPLTATTNTQPNGPAPVLAQPAT